MTIDKSANTQILLTLPKDLLEEIEAYWHQEHLPNRSAAIRQLIQIALDKEKTSQ